MADYKPNLPFTVPAKLLIWVGETTVKGVPVKIYSDVENAELIYVSFRGFGGTEKQVNGMTVVEDTATVETYFRPEIRANSRLVIGGKTYEILGEPENINMRNQFMKFKVRAIAGGA